MKIQSTAIVRRAIRCDPETISEISTARGFEVSIDAAAAVPNDEVESYSYQISRQGNIEGINLALKFNASDHKDMQIAADRLQVIADELNSRSSALKPQETKPNIDFVRTGAGATLGAVGGLSAGLLLQELGKAGSASGNPYLSTISIACTIGGAALGAGVGSGFLSGEFDGFGINIKTRETKEG